MTSSYQTTIAKPRESVLEVLFAHQLRACGLTEGMEQEYRFHPKRRWRFDFAWPEKRIAVEVEGGTWTGGRHTRGAGFEADCEKYMEALLAGWRVLRVTAGLVRDGRAVNATEALLK